MGGLSWFHLPGNCSIQARRRTCDNPAFCLSVRTPSAEVTYVPYWSLLENDAPCSSPAMLYHGKFIAVLLKPPRMKLRILMRTDCSSYCSYVAIWKISIQGLFEQTFGFLASHQESAKIVEIYRFCIGFLFACFAVYCQVLLGFHRERYIIKRSPELCSAIHFIWCHSSLN